MDELSMGSKGVCRFKTCLTELAFEWFIIRMSSHVLLQTSFTLEPFAANVAAEFAFSIVDPTDVVEKSIFAGQLFPALRTFPFGGVEVKLDVFVEAGFVFPFQATY